MAEVVVYLRLAPDRNARHRWRVEATPASNPRPLLNAAGEPLHTLRTRLRVVVPDEMLRPQDWPTITVALDVGTGEQVPMTITPEAIDPAPTPTPASAVMEGIE